MISKSIQRLTDTLDIEFVITNGMQNAISKYEIQNTKYTCHKEHGFINQKKKVCIKVTYKTVNEHRINKT
jgi:hypothetical protein